MSSIVAKRSPLSPRFRFGNSQKSYAAISGECSGVVELWTFFYPLKIAELQKTSGTVHCNDAKTNY
jgi:hypothetical protein